MVRLTVDLRNRRPLDHYWERCVGSGHAALGLRSDWRAQLKRCREELGFEYVRFHGLLNDDMSVCKRRAGGRLEYSFFNVDSIFDFLLDIGMKPFVELSFMPTDIASGSQTAFHYRGNVTPPKSYDEWYELIRTLVAHLVQRYGAREVRTWFFEVWNEPNLNYFWAGSQEDYFHLYSAAARAIKSVDAELRVGGPATARNEWIGDMITFCRSNGVPLDFVSTHHYPTDIALGHGSDMEERMARSRRGILTEMVIKAVEEAQGYPLFYTEWSNSPSSRDTYHDQPYAAAFVVKTIADHVGLLQVYSFWAFSDIFEEDGFASTPFHGGFGLLTIHGVPKPTYRAFQLLHELGPEQVDVSVEAPGESTIDALAGRDSKRAVMIVSNHNIPRAPILKEDLEIVCRGLEATPRATLRRIDDDHANARKRWIEMGCPEYLDTEQVQSLMRASEMKESPIEPELVDSDAVFRLSVPPHGVAAITLEWD